MFDNSHLTLTTRGIINNIINSARCMNRRFKQETSKNYGITLARLCRSVPQYYALTLFQFFSSFACFLRGTKSCHLLVGGFFPPLHPCGLNFIPNLRYNAIELSNLQHVHDAPCHISVQPALTSTWEMIRYLHFYLCTISNIKLPSHRVVCPI